MGTTATPPAFLHLVGHPLRWQLLSSLAESDHTVRELTDRTDEPQNLVSYHLRKLRDAGLVSARRSSADRRDSYYSVALRALGEALTSTGAALHPGLRLATAPTGPSTGRVLFLCTGNSARSQMAEALTVLRSDGAVEAHSAGSAPKALHPEAVRVLGEEYGVDLSGARTKHVDEVFGKRFDRVVTLCDRVKEVCPTFAGGVDPVHWSIPDPSVDGGREAFRQTADELDTRIGFLLRTLEEQ